MLMDNELGGRPNFFPSDDDDEPCGGNGAVEDAAATEPHQPFPADPEPWPTPVDGSDLLDELQEAVKARAIMGDHGDVACALWVIHTYCYKVFLFTPRLFVNAPTHACGKSTVLDCLEKLVHRPLAASDATGAAVVRLIEAWGPTLLVDEHDSMRYADMLRNIFNSGFARGKQTIRVEGVFSTFAPFALASTTRLATAMLSRSIVLRLRRKLPTEKTLPVSGFDGTYLRRNIARWVLDNQPALEQAQPRFPRGITDRLADAWKPLLAIADRAAGKWPKLAREAAVALSTRHDQPSMPELLLADIREVFGADEAVFSSELVKRLLAKSDAPWTGEGLNEWLLAQKLEPFGIYPKKMRLGEENKRGYLRSAFAEVWQRWQIDTP
jgi:hypothetical protein